MQFHLGKFPIMEYCKSFTQEYPVLNTEKGLLLQ